MKIHQKWLRSCMIGALGLSSLWTSTSFAAKCEYLVTNEWNNGFTASIRITNNTKTPIQGWSVNWTYSDGSLKTSGWNATFSGKQPYYAANLDWNANIQPGQFIEFGVQGTKAVVNQPANIAQVKGNVCTSVVTSSSAVSLQPVRSSSSSSKRPIISSASSSAVAISSVSSSKSSLIRSSAVTLSSTKTTSSSSSSLVRSSSSKPTSSVSGNLVYTPVAEPQSRYPRGILVSSRYRVMAKLASDTSAWNPATQTTATYEAWPDYPDRTTSVPSAYQNIHVHMAQIDANARVRFRVELLGSNRINTLELKPSRITSLAATQEFGSQWAEFEVDPSDYTRSVLVEINEPVSSSVLDHGLMIFLNPISKAPAPATDVLVLPSGVVDATTAPTIIDRNNTLLIDANSPYTKVYIPRDTIINGRIQAKKAGVSISGRGIVVGSRWNWPKSDPNWSVNYPITADHKVVKGLIELNSGNLEGITSMLPYHFNFVGGQNSINLKAFGWRYSSDGIHDVDVVRGCFTRVNDDHIYFRERNIQYSTFWGMSNGSIFQGGWGTTGDMTGGYIAHNDIIRGEWTGDGGDRQNNGIIGSVNASDSSQTGVTFEDIRIQGNVCRLLNFEMPKNNKIWKNFMFKDIWLEKPLGCLAGADRAAAPLHNILEIGGSLQNVTFDNLTIGGQKILDLQLLEPIDLLNTNNIVFK